ncbi:MAG: YCF48-related protein [candidate division WOR-3 bacterium]
MRFTVIFASLTLAALPAAGYIYHGVAVAPDGNNAWVVPIDSIVVYHTTDFGDSWTGSVPFTERWFFDVFFLDEMRGWICGMAGYIAYSSDGGATWQRVCLGGPKHAARIRMVDDQFGWAAGGDLVQLRTTDGGQTWEQIFLLIPPFPARDTAEFNGVWFVDHQYGWLVGGHWPQFDSASGDTLFTGGQGIIARNREGGRDSAWTVQRFDTVFDFYDVYFADTLHGWVCGGSDRTLRGVILHTTDGGQTWTEQPIPSGAGFLRAMRFTSPACGWVCGRNGTILHTTNGGQTWINQNSGIDTTLFDIDFADSLRGMVAGNSVVLFTTDGGQTWRRTLGLAESRPTLHFPNNRLQITVGRNPNAQGVLFRLTGVEGSYAIPIYDAAGCHVRTIPGYSRKDRTTVSWDGLNQYGQRVSPGLYLARLQSSAGTATVKFTYLPPEN